MSDKTEINGKENKMIRFIVTAVDYGDSCDGKARIIFTTNNKDEAKKFVYEDMKLWCKNYQGLDYKCDFDDMSTSYNNNMCEWNIEEVQIEDALDFNDIRKFACKYFECHSNGNKSSKYLSDYTAQNFIEDIMSYVETW